MLRVMSKNREGCGSFRVVVKFTVILVHCLAYSVRARFTSSQTKPESRKKVYSIAIERRALRCLPMN